MHATLRAVHRTQKSEYRIWEQTAPAADVLHWPLVPRALTSNLLEEQHPVFPGRSPGREVQMSQKERVSVL